MTDFMPHLFTSWADQAGTWFIGVVLAVLGAFSGRLVESIKLALNRADMRTRYYEEMAVDMSRFVFVIDRILRVSLGSTWATDDDRSAIAGEYNEVTNAILSKEYVYLSWLKRYWKSSQTSAFKSVMQRIRAVDLELIRLNEMREDAKDVTRLKVEFLALQREVDALLMTSL